MSDFNRLTKHVDYPAFEGFLFGQNTETGEVLVSVSKPGEMPGVKKMQMVWIPLAKATFPTEKPNGNGLSRNSAR